MRIYPKRLKPVKFYVKDRVRHMLRATLGKTTFYKSYEGMRSDKHAMWSKTRYRIAQKRKIAGRIKYMVNGTWWLPSQLLLCEDSLVVLKGAKRVRPERKKKPPRPNPLGPGRKAVVRKPVAPKPPPATRRSSRLSRKPKVSYIGM
jgi:hypothetical protein